MKKISAHEIALSAVACALATIAMTAGTLWSVLLFTGYLLGSFALMLPLAKNCWWGDVLAYAGACILTLFFNGFRIWDTLPFIVFFGLHPLVNALQLKFRINRWVAAAVKAIWFDASMYLVWRFVFGGMTNSFAFVDEYILPIILIGGTLFFLVYDRLFFRCQGAVNVLVNRFLGKK